MPDDGGWMTREVAEAQRELIERELAPLRLYLTNKAATPEPVLAEPYTPFLKALDEIRPPMGTRLLDVGCGVGHYGTVCRILRPNVIYTGTDVSRHMVAIARRRETGLSFLIRAVLDNEFAAYPIVLLSQCVEVTDAPAETLEAVIRATPGALVLHRLRLGQTTGRITEPTYAGHMGYNYLWSWPDLVALVASAGRRQNVVPWSRPDMLTMIVWPTDG